MTRYRPMQDAIDSGRRLTRTEFIELYAAVDDEKLELIDGFATVRDPPGRRYARIARNLAIAISARLSNGKAMLSERALQTGAATLRYPVASVYLDPRDVDHAGDVLWYSHPSVIFLIGGDDFEFGYQCVKSLKTIVVINRFEDRVKLCGRDKGHWTATLLDKDADLVIRCPPMVLTAAEIFAAD